MFLITAKQDGFRRAGIAHPAEPTEYADDFFNDEQIEAIMDDDMLSIEHVADDTDADADKTQPADHPFDTITAFDRALGLAIVSLGTDKTNRDFWTKSGAPQTKALSLIMGEEITAGMRDVAYKIHTEAV